MKKTCLFILFAFCLITSMCQVKLNKSNWYDLKGQVFILRENSISFGAKDAIGLFQSGKFEIAKIYDNRINEGYVFTDIWLAIPITNTTNITLPIEAGLQNGSVYKLHTYFFDNQNGICIDSFTVSKFYPYSQRPIDSRHFYFPFTVKPHISYTILFQIDVRGNNFQFPLAIVSPAWRALHETKMGNFYAAVSGGFLLLSLLSFIWWVWARDRLNFFYFGYVFIYGMMFLSDGEFDFKWLYPNFPAWAVISTGMYGCMEGLFTLLFMDSFLDLKKSHRLLHRLTMIICTVDLILILLIPMCCIFSGNMLFKRMVFYLGAVLVPLSWFWPVYCIATRVRDGFFLAKIYAVAFLGVVFSASLYILNGIGLLNNKILPPNCWLLGIAVEIIVLFIALAVNHSRIRNKNQVLENELNIEKLRSSEQLLEAQETEQKRIAMDLHDELGGNLAAIKMNLQGLGIDKERELPLLRLIDAASGSCRTIAHNLMPPHFEQTPFESLLRNHYYMLSSESKISFNFYCSDYAPYFSKTQELFIYRILMELTSNVLKHANATECSVQLVYYPTKLIILVEDDGKGLSNNGGNGMGLENIRSRVKTLNGNLQIDDRTKGTSVVIEIPFKKAQNE